MSEPPTPLPTRRPRIDSELSCSVSTMSEISTSSSQLQTQNRTGSHVRIYNMHIANADLRTVHTEKAEITNVNIDKAENVNSSNDSNKTNSRNTDAGLKIIDDAEWHIRFHEENGIRLNNTQVFHEAVKKLGWNKVIVIVGNSGCGKRSLSMELLRHFSNDETEFGCTPVIIKDSCDWNTHVNPKCEYIILLDSLCGSAGIFNREHILKWDPYFKDILKYIKNSKEFNEPFFVIMTMRDKIWKENKIFFREYDLFRELENYIFDMTNEYGFSCKEKYMMLSNILSKSYKQKLTRVQICSEYRQEYLEESNSHDLKISERTLKHISRISTPVGFLRCIVEFVGNERHTKKGSVFFERPLDLLVNELNFLLHLEENKENLYHYFLLILIVWHDGCFYLNRPLQCEEDILSLINEDNETKILNFFYNFTISKRNGIYFKFSEEMNCCELTHEALSDAVCLSLGKRCIAFVLKKCSNHFLSEYIHVNAKDDNNRIQVIQKNYSCLSQRFIKELLGKKFEIVSTHEALDSEEFVQNFIQHLSKDMKCYATIVVDEKCYGLLWFLFNQEKPKFKLIKYILKNPPLPMKKPEKKAFQIYWSETLDNCMWAACHLGCDDSFTLLKEYIELSDRHVRIAERSTNSVFIETVRECKRKQDEQRQQDKKSSCNIL
ncbi:uncharacterized protein LOC143085607 [Mytilus galloprovincialis]|uniref:uncharacterized protein LOC143085607 n=1 Tax=Mytilus galloprovincialis TaxID=29158 RepID=UPI003F7C8E12